MNVKAIIREVLVELSSKGTPAAAPWLPDRFLKIRKLGLDPLVDEFDLRKPAVGGNGRQPGGHEGVGSDSSPPEIVTKQCP